MSPLARDNWVPVRRRRYQR
ncbi:hypothetical protein QPX30_05780 [Corynebacterium pseudodiphtheriticum]|nr:hypothetical protein [Corynebacterium pseudodiphtheriticum]MDK4296624.1 hypothetical protein [Corynebacterium pseudodiphtheriticum]